MIHDCVVSLNIGHTLGCNFFLNDHDHDRVENHDHLVLFNDRKNSSCNSFS